MKDTNHFSCDFYSGVGLKGAGGAQGVKNLVFSGWTIKPKLSTSFTVSKVFSVHSSFLLLSINCHSLDSPRPTMLILGDVYLLNTQKPNNHILNFQVFFSLYPIKGYIH